MAKRLPGEVVHLPVVVQHSSKFEILVRSRMDALSVRGDGSQRTPAAVIAAQAGFATMAAYLHRDLTFTMSDRVLAACGVLAALPGFVSG